MTPYDRYQHITFDRSDDGVLTVTLNRPEALNATDEMLHRELSWCLLILRGIKPLGRWC